MTTVDWQPEKQTDKRDYSRPLKFQIGKGGLPTCRPALKTNHNEKENLFVAATILRSFFL
ncbi:MAG: hypothetical protein K2P91_08410 [Bacteroides acidifaciens]|nr:hypothetical protein [Bacteroides acidifaciens]